MGLEVEVCASGDVRCRRPAEVLRVPGLNEVYLSVAAAAAANQAQLAHSIALLHPSNIRVEALLSSVDADQPGKRRDKLLSRVQGIERFNPRHPNEPFDGIHLDVEPHQRRENKGPAISSSCRIW